MKAWLQQEIRSVEHGVCPMQVFHFWSRHVHPVQNLMLCTKFHENRIIFRWDLATYRFSKWRPSAMLNFGNFHFWLPVAAPAISSCRGTTGTMVSTGHASLWHRDRDRACKPGPSQTVKRGFPVSEFATNSTYLLCGMRWHCEFLPREWLYCVSKKYRLPLDVW